jgi:glutamyl-tRNA synthetase
MTVVGRLAPSPTGSLHVGNVRTFLWAWLSARSQRGRVLLRVEDLDTPRVKEGVVPKVIDDLRWLGFDWDGEIAVQSDRRAIYREVFAKLDGRVYPCRCTRGDIAAAQSAPHEGDQEPRYPGTCRSFGGPGIAWRLRVEPGAVEFEDRLYGQQSIDVGATVGDFVVARTPEQPAYQLAVVGDDLAQGVTEVVRGDDLIPSTARQILVHRALGATPPAYAHVPLVVGTDGKRLAKRFGRRPDRDAPGPRRAVRADHRRARRLVRPRRRRRHARVPGPQVVVGTRSRAIGSSSPPERLAALGVHP